ncbi:hypothetical protein [Streptomyces sp. NPDC054765]
MRVRPRQLLCLLALMVSLLTLAAPATPASAAPDPVNAKPAVVPALQKWQGRTLGLYGRVADQNGNKIDGLVNSVTGPSGSLQIVSQGLSTCAQGDLPAGDVHTCGMTGEAPPAPDPADRWRARHRPADDAPTTVC